MANYKLINTKKWNIQPKAGYSFRIGRTVCFCKLRFLNFCLIRIERNIITL